MAAARHHAATSDVSQLDQLANMRRIYQVCRRNRHAWPWPDDNGALPDTVRVVIIREARDGRVLSFHAELACIRGCGVVRTEVHERAGIRAPMVRVGHPTYSYRDAPGYLLKPTGDPGERVRADPDTVCDLQLHAIYPRLAW